MKVYFRELLADWLKLFHASKAASLSLFIVGIFSGIEQLLLSFTLGKFFDSLIGARGLRIMTGDVSKWFWLLILVIVLATGVRYLSKSFTGLMESLRQRMKLITQIFATAIIGIVAVPLHVVSALCITGFARTRIDVRAKKIASFLTTILLFAGIYSLLESTVIRDASIGQFIFWSTAIVLFGRQLVLLNTKLAIKS